MLVLEGAPEEAVGTGTLEDAVAMALEPLAKGIKTKDAVRQAADCTGIAKTYFTTRCSAPAQTEEVPFMGSRRAAFPTHDEPHHNILDGPNMPHPQRSHQRGSQTLLGIAGGSRCRYRPVFILFTCEDGCSLALFKQKTKLFLCACARCRRPFPRSGPPLSAEASDALQRPGLTIYLQQDAVF